MPKYTWYAVQVANEHGVIDDHSVWHQHETEDAANDMLGGFPFPGFLVRENSRGDRRFDFGGGWKQTPAEAVEACKEVNELDPEMPPGAVVSDEPVETEGLDSSAALAVLLEVPEDADADMMLASVATALDFKMSSAAILEEVRKIVAAKSTGSRSAAKIAEMTDDMKSALDGVVEALTVKIDGRRDWETLGRAIHRFDKAAGGAVANREGWDCPADVWNALTGYQRFLCMTGHNKTGWAHGGPRTIYGVKCPSHTGSGYDKQRDRLKTALEAMGLDCGEYIRNAEGLVVMLNIASINVD